MANSRNLGVRTRPRKSGLVAARSESIGLELSLDDERRSEADRRSTNSYVKKLPQPDIVYLVDFFAGCGGMSWGFASTRQSHLSYRVLAGIDIDKKALSTYEKNVGAPGIAADIASIADRPNSLVHLLGDVDPRQLRPLVFVGCAPCQGFSAHRKKDRRDDPRNNLMAAFAKICLHFRPDVIVMENVPEVITGRYRGYFQAAAALLEGGGYSLSLDVLDLSLYGVPQRRRRAVVLGSLHGSIELPAPLFSREAAPSVRDAISHLRPIQAGECDPYDPMHRAPAHTSRILSRIKKTPADGGDRRALSLRDQLECHVSVDSGETPGFTDVYGRLRWDTPSVTITAKSSTPSCGRFLHPEQHRNISVREAAILQGFPQGYQFVGPLVHLYRQIGEAVPPLFARQLGWRVLDHLNSSVHRPILGIGWSEGQRVHTDPAVHAEYPKVVDCFCGAGGLALGFEAAGFVPAFAVDSDPTAVETFRRNISEVAEVADVRDPALAPAIDAAVGESSFVIVGGPPCQGFSQQRRGSHEDSRNDLVLSFADLIASTRKKPAVVMLENVTYLDSPRGRLILREYGDRLRQLGYSVMRHDLNSAEYGVPQLRSRIVLVAMRKELAGSYVGPQPLTSGRWVTVGEALHGLPDASSNDAFLWPNHEPSREGALNRRRISYVDMGYGRRSIPPDLQLDCHTQYDGHLDVYGRLDWFGQARTITGGFDSYTRGEYAHPFRHRSITAREAARIQGFPDWFVFLGNRASVRRQIGNAVPPSLAFALAKGVAAVLTEPQLALRHG
jgi:DNA (cytosine-5)-methyltransferase 1